MSETCPICHEQMYDVCLTVTPPRYVKQCFICGYVSPIQENERIFKVDTHIEYDKIAEVLSEYYYIPCALCRRYFQQQKDSCPPETTGCSNRKHWKLLLERIGK